VRKIGLVLGLALLAAPLPAFAQERDQHGSNYSEGGFDDLSSKDGPRSPNPLARAKYEEAVGRLFAAADTNKDGTVTLAEFQAIIAGRREQAISERFADIDGDHNKALSYDEFARWQRGLGSTVLAEGGGPVDGIVAEEIQLTAGRTPDSQAIARVIAPLSSTAIAAANTNYDAGVSLAELTAYEDKRFDQFDANKDGWITVDELRTRPTSPAAPPRSAG
jgi:Ca2+-binding EF-hand superfamily protein